MEVGGTAVSDATTNVPPGALLLGREWLGFDDSGEVASIRFQALPSFANRHGTIQGGFLAAMLDSATGLRALAALSPGLTAVTRNLDTLFLKPAHPGPITASARVASQDDREIEIGRAHV